MFAHARDATCFGIQTAACRQALAYGPYIEANESSARFRIGISDAGVSPSERHGILGLWVVGHAAVNGIVDGRQIVDVAHGGLQSADRRMVSDAQSNVLEPFSMHELVLNVSAS